MGLTKLKKYFLKISEQTITRGSVGGFVLFIGAFLVAVFIFSNFLITPADSASGIINKLSYQGRLTDTGGSPLGGSGTNYCFRFSIYDAQVNGNKLWPSGTPATTTLSVVNGVFNAEIGSADALDFDFYNTSTAFLNVEVNTTTSTCTGTWESLTPRQQILATGYAIAAENVYGDLLKTNVANNIVQVGTGAGSATTSLTYLAVDIANVVEALNSPCDNNGAVWYNSNASNTQFLGCVGGRIKNLNRGNMVLLGDVTLSSATATIDITISEPREHMTCYLETKGGSVSGIAQVRFNNDSGAAAYQWNTTYIIATAVADIQDASDSEIQLTGTTADSDPTTARLDITNFADTNKNVIFDTVTTEAVGTNANRYQGVGSYYNTSEQINAVNFFRSAGNFNAGSRGWCEGRNFFN